MTRLKYRSLDLQLAILLVLWAGFLYSQLLKSKYQHCTWEFGAIAGSQALILAAVTAAVMAYQSWLAKVCCMCIHAIPYHGIHSEYNSNESAPRVQWALPG